MKGPPKGSALTGMSSTETKCSKTDEDRDVFSTSRVNHRDTEDIKQAASYLRYFAVVILRLRSAR